MNRYVIPPEPKNEPVLGYEPGSQERKELKKSIDEFLKGPPLEIPLVIGREEVHTKEKMANVCPHDRRHVLANVSVANEELVNKAIDNALEAKVQWVDMCFEDRFLIFLRAAELLSKKYRYKINAATMLGLSKNVFQAEIDSACELIDFLRFNVRFAWQLYEMQPISPGGQFNRMIYRPLEGFVFAVSPFNFVSIAGNLPTAPAIMGNVVVFKPVSSAVFPACIFYMILVDNRRETKIASDQ
jgi:1-pyrroline-5-carboxylate dehydrogenase